MSIIFCFFFQAEDGIRDLTVTGVQTCALPISPIQGRDAQLARAALPQPDAEPQAPPGAVSDLRLRENVGVVERHAERIARSEERRVGKECRARWSREH